MATETTTKIIRTKVPDKGPHHKILEHVKALKDEHRDIMTPTFWMRLLLGVDGVDAVGFSKQLSDGRWARKGSFTRGTPPFDKDFLDQVGDNVEQWLATTFGDGSYICYGLANHIQTAQININVGFGIRDGAVPENTPDDDFDQILVKAAKNEGRLTSLRQMRALNEGNDGSDMKMDLAGLAELIKAVNGNANGGGHAPDPEIQRLREELIILKAKAEAGANPMQMLSVLVGPALSLLEKKPSLLGFVSRLLVPAATVAENPVVPGPTLMETLGEIAAHPAVSPILSSLMTMLAAKMAAVQATPPVGPITPPATATRSNVIPFPPPTPGALAPGGPMLDLQNDDIREAMAELIGWIRDKEYEAAFDALRTLQHPVIREWCMLITPLTNAKGHALALRTFHPDLKALGAGACEEFVMEAKAKVEKEMNLLDPDVMKIDP